MNFLRRWYCAGPRFTLMILGTFGVTGLLLVLTDIFSVMAYLVSLRTHEIGVRMALRAQPKDVLRMVLKKGLTLVLVGTISGLVASDVMTRLMATQIWGVSATDPWTFFAVAVVILAVDLAGCMFPAGSGPAASLHYE
jgi:putative ABC transport system permease protein